MHHRANPCANLYKCPRYFLLVKSKIFSGKRIRRRNKWHSQFTGNLFHQRYPFRCVVRSRRSVCNMDIGAPAERFRNAAGQASKSFFYQLPVFRIEGANRAFRNPFLRNDIFGCSCFNMGYSHQQGMERIHVTAHNRLRCLYKISNHDNRICSCMRTTGMRSPAKKVYAKFIHCPIHKSGSGDNRSDRICGAAMQSINHLHFV